MVNYSAMPHKSTFAVGYPCDNWYHETKEKILDSPDFQRFPCYTREDFFDYFIEYGLERKDVKFAVSRHRILPYTCLIRESVKFACESVRTMRRSSANWQVLILLPTE